MAELKVYFSELELLEIQTEAREQGMTDEEFIRFKTLRNVSTVLTLNEFIKRAQALPKDTVFYCPDLFTKLEWDSVKEIGYKGRLGRQFRAEVDEGSLMGQFEFLGKKAGARAQYKKIV